ncbi:MAG: hypothetical protein LJE62_01825 [Silicimonas sp.]|jgi:hypothetical protein|nr:hypothetical protein [Silicimonas sp.]
MSFKTKSVLFGVGLLALAACGETSSKSWNSEAGAFIDEGGFGNPTMNNMLAQMCKGRAKGYIVPDPIVAIDGVDEKGAPRYREGKVMCNGPLNGKYARVIWGGYVGSAVAPSPIGGGLAAIDGG